VVITPEALAKSKFKTCQLSEYGDKNFDIDADEAFYFRFPSPSLINQANGDGDLLEIWDFTADFKKIVTKAGDLDVTPETIIYYR
jgi:hypothetical protein